MTTQDFALKILKGFEKRTALEDMSLGEAKRFLRAIKRAAKEANRPPERWW